MSMVTTIIPIAAVAAFDDFFHQFVLWPAVVVHVAGIVWYFIINKKRSNTLTKWYIASSLLFAATIIFHFSEIHNHIFHPNDHHEGAAHSEEYKAFEVKGLQQ
jgi:RsiW-degrading membrane proteinase PrsW (M82 family)